jgi:hypothetical protein
MTKPIPDKAEVALEYPEKLFIGTFEHSSRFDAHLDQSGISLSLYRTGAVEQRKSIRMHFHYGLFAKSCATSPKPYRCCRRRMRGTAMHCGRRRNPSILRWTTPNVRRK